MLAPTTLRDALRRYVAENRQAMLWFRRSNPEDPNSKRLPLLTTPASIDAPAGVYYSCRFDTSPRKGCGGLDSYFPMSKDSDVYAIADVALVRGVHDILRENSSSGGGSAAAVVVDRRAGHPEWWEKEEESVARERAFDPRTLEKLDTAVPWPRMPDEKGWRRVENGKAKLRFANGATQQGGSDSYTFGTLVFDTFKSPHTDPCGAAGAMPHHDDMAMTRLPIYPKRLTPTSERAVWRRWLDNELRHSNGHTEISDPDTFGDAARLWPSERGYRQRRTTDEMDGGAGGGDERPSSQVAPQRVAADRKRLSTLVAPCYVLALEYDDFAQAVQKGEEKWCKYFEKHEAYWLNADVYAVFEVQTAAGVRYHLGPNPDYVLPTQAVPTRVDGRWDTYDGPPPVWRASGGGGEWHVPDALRCSVRPAARMHASWHRDKREFGSRPGPGSDEAEKDAPLRQLKRRVAIFEDAFVVYEHERKAWTDLRKTNNVIDKANERLRFHSLRLVWNLSRLQQTKHPRELFAADREACFARSGAAEAGVMQQWDFRLPVVIFLIDTLDHADRVRADIDTFTVLSGLLRGGRPGAPGGNNNTEMLDRVRAAVADTPDLPFVKDLVELDCAWPNVSDIDRMLAPGAAKLNQMLGGLIGVPPPKPLDPPPSAAERARTKELWLHVVGVANDLIATATDPAADAAAAARDAAAAHDPMHRLPSKHRILAGMEKAAIAKRYAMVRARARARVGLRARARCCCAQSRARARARTRARARARVKRS